MTTTEAQSQRPWSNIPTHATANANTQTHAPSFALTWPDAVKSLIVFVVTVLALLSADMALLWLHPNTYRVDVGNYRDTFFLTDAHRQEVADSSTYRWTKAISTLQLTQIGIAHPALFTLDLGGRPAAGELQLTLNDQSWTGFTTDVAGRRYTLLLPPDAPGALTIGLHSTTFTPPGDARSLGVKLEAFGLTFPHSSLPGPTPAQYLTQILLVLAVQLTTIRLGWGWRGQALVVGVLALALAALLSSALLLSYVYIQRLAIAGAALAALTWIVLPIAERKLTWMGGVREVRLLWAIMLVCCIIRFIGVFYPTFGAQDLGRNLRRLMMTIRGDLVIIAWSGEFADGDTIYPPGPYLGVMPGITLTSDLGALLQGTLAFLDGTTAFLVAMLAWRLGGNRHAARLAMVLYTSNLAVFGAMTYGFAAQVFGQWFTAPLALLLLAPGALSRVRTWGLATILLLFGVLSHIGVAILGITWFGLILLLLLVLGPRRSSLWWGIAFFIGGIGLAFVLLYTHIFATTITHLTANVVPEHSGFELRGNTPLLWKGLRMAYGGGEHIGSAILLMLLPLGLLLLARAKLDRERMVVPLAWVLTTLLYFTVDLVSALQVRYFYFSLPLASTAMALVLGQLAVRGRWGRPVAWALVLALAIPNILLWYAATMADGKISMTPLTH